MLYQYSILLLAKLDRFVTYQRVATLHEPNCIFSFVLSPVPIPAELPWPLPITGVLPWLPWYSRCLRPWSIRLKTVHKTALGTIFGRQRNLWRTAELSQRRPRDAPNIWVPSKFRESSQTPLATFPEICNGLLFRSILRMCVQNLKFVALPVP